MDIPSIEDLTALFEVPPLGYEDRTPANYQELRFKTKQGSDDLEIMIYAPSGLLEIRWLKLGVPQLSTRMVSLDKIETHFLSGNEFLSASRVVQDTKLLIKLRLKPIIELEINETFDA